MRLASYRVGENATFGIVTATGVINLNSRLQELRSLKELLAAGIEQAVPFLGERDDHLFEDICWEPVIPDPGQILCVGLNYKAHAAEVGRPAGDRPTIFLRVAQSQCGHGEPVVRPHASTELDFEGELALVVGRVGRHIAPANALDHVAGYSLYNDVSLRDWQRHTGQYTPGKNFPATGAFGPWLTTTDEIRDPTALQIETRVNGKTVQSAPLTDLIFPIPEVLAYLSTFTELRPGDVVITGTPAGVGSMRSPPLWLEPGDTVEVEIPQIGILSNPVVQEA